MLHCQKVHNIKLLLSNITYKYNAYVVYFLINMHWMNSLE